MKGSSLAMLALIVACASAPPSRVLPRATDPVVRPGGPAFHGDERCPTISACEGHEDTPGNPEPAVVDAGTASSAEAPIATDASTSVAPSDEDTTDEATIVTPPPSIARADVSYALRQGVVVTNSAAYVLGAEQGIDAISLADGRVVWHSDDAALPLHVAGDRLITMRAAPHHVILLSMDARDGTHLKACGGAMDLPTGASASATDGLGYQFQVRVRDDGNSLSLGWWASTQYVGGVPPTERVRAAAERQAGGGMLVAKRTCRVVQSAPTRSKPKPLNYGMDLPLTAGPFEIDGWKVVIEIDENLVRIHHSQNARTQPVIELASPTGMALMSLNHRHVLIADALGPDGAFQMAQVHRTADGTHVASIPFGPQAPEMFVVIGTRVMFATEEALHVHDHATPARSFVHPLRPIQYRGPYPPSAPSGPGGPSQRPGNPRPLMDDLDLR